LGEGKRITPIRQVRMVLPTKIISIRIRVMGWPWFEVIDICNLASRGLGKRTPNLTIQSDKVKRSTAITRRGGINILY